MFLRQCLHTSVTRPIEGTITLLYHSILMTMRAKAGKHLECTVWYLTSVTRPQHHNKSQCG